MIKMFARGAIATLSVRLIALGCAFAMEVLLARVLSPVDYGLYSIAMTWLALLTLVAVFGLDTAAVKVIPRYRFQKSWAELHEFLKFSSRAPLILSVLFLVFFLIVGGFRGNFSGSLFYPLLLAMLLLPVSASANVRSAILRSLMHPVQADLPLGVVRPLFVIVATSLALALFDSHISAVTAIGFHCIALLGAIVIFRYLIRKNMEPEVAAAAPAVRDVSWMSVTFPMFVVAGLTLLNSRIDILMIGGFLGEEKAGVYSVASRIAELLTVSLTAVNAIVAPRFSQLYAAGDIIQLQKLVTTSARLVLAVTLIFGAGILVFEGFFFDLFGARFAQASSALHILMVAQAINAVSGSVGYLMLMTDQHRIAILVLGGAAIVNVVCNVILVPKYGIEGAAFATAIAITFWNLSFVAWIGKKLGINATAIRL